MDYDYYDQLECQKLCVADSDCVGITWNKVGSSQCYRCKDDTLGNVGSLPYGFYRKPSGNNEHAVYTELVSLR